MPGALVVVAHGSRAEAANAAHRAVVADLAHRLPDVRVTAAFLELAEPDIATAIDEAVGAGCDAVAVLPHFLYPGRHLVDDIPALVAEGVGRHPGVAIHLLPAFGADPAVADLLADQARRGLSEPPAR